MYNDLKEIEIVHSISTEKITAYHWLMFAICFICDMFGGTVSTLMSVYLPVVAKDFLGQIDAVELNKVSAYINSLYLFGWMFGGIMWGMLSDRLGRAQTVILSVACYSLFTLLTGKATSWQWIVICRFISGFGVGGVLVSTTTLVSEVWIERSRAIAVGILSIAFPIGIFSAGLTNYFVSNWRQGFLLGLVPLAFAILSIWLLRESERWKASRNQQQQSAQKKTSIFEADHLKDLIIGSVTFGTMLVGLWAIFSWLPTWVQSLLTSDGSHERGLSMMLLGAGGLTGGFFSGWISNTIGFRRAMIICFSGCLCMSFLLFKVNTTFSSIIYVEIACLALFFGASQGILSAYIPQLFPTAIRATATGFCFNLGRLVTASVVFFVGALVVVLGGYGNAIFTFSWIFLIGLITTFFSKDPTTGSKNSINQPEIK